jgi:hypothetical protein
LRRRHSATLGRIFSWVHPKAPCQRQRLPLHDAWGVTVDGPAHVEKGLNTTTYRTCASAKTRFVVDLGLIDNHTD